ncbi:Hypothetical predicted protein [Pelobates cultripes]|uniref:Uncharacterized protein n=1 Tax=Pelobates cultripes TaxID=61616 RepID=A0AAD1QZ61_PELCU|nr:Hypothetical predicted protein [Pelobates cultripes]
MANLLERYNSKQNLHSGVHIRPQPEPVAIHPQNPHRLDRLHGGNPHTWRRSQHPSGHLHRTKQHPTERNSKHPESSQTPVAGGLLESFTSHDERVHALLESPREILENRHIFLQQEQLTALQGATIEATTWSDHGAVTMEMDSPLTRPKVMTWRLNDTLLMDVEIRDKIVEALDASFSNNETEETSATSAHKCVLRGHIIQLATKKKKETQ